MTIVVQDVNDNRPNIIVNVLTASGSAEVRENVDEAGTFVAHLSSRDADSGNYGAVECQLNDVGSQPFRLVSLYDDLHVGSVDFIPRIYNSYYYYYNYCYY